MVHSVDQVFSVVLKVYENIPDKRKHLAQSVWLTYLLSIYLLKGWDKK